MFVPRLQSSVLTLTTESLSPLIVHHFSEKARKEIREGESRGAAKKARVAKTDAMRVAEYRASAYESEDGWHGIPAGGFRQAMIRAGKLIGVQMTDARTLFRVIGDGRDNDTAQELLKLYDSKGKPFTWKRNKPIMREDYVRLKSGGTTLRYRAQYWPWTLKLSIEFDPSLVDANSILALVERAGACVGQCEWRPEKNGEFGRFAISSK